MTTKNQLKWRRNKVLDYLARGLNQSEIAENLKVSNSTITNDVNYLMSQAKEQIKNHIEDKIPIEFISCLNGINEILKSAWDIIQNSEDEKTQLQALALANDCYTHKMELVTNGVVVTEAVKFVQQNKKQELLSKDTENYVKKSIPVNDLKTTNSMF